jgi:hypothetical protein
MLGQKAATSGLFIHRGRRIDVGTCVPFCLQSGSAKGVDEHVIHALASELTTALLVWQRP